MMKNKTYKFGFFGSSSFSIAVLNELEKHKILPTVIITTPDKPKGRNLIMTPSDTKVWGDTRQIPVLCPEKLSDPDFQKTLKEYNCEVFIVASYGKIIPESILYMPKEKTLNIHPSLLPAYRGASPIQSMILADETSIGVSIMELDKEMDHGPIVIKQEVLPVSWPLYEEQAELLLATEGGKILAELLPQWLNKQMPTTPQEHSKATYTKKFTKEDGLLDLSNNPRTNYLKILAFHRSPKAYFFDEYNGQQIRVIVTSARFENQNLVIEKVIPEGKKEMLYTDYLRGKK